MNSEKSKKTSPVDGDAFDDDEDDFESDGSFELDRTVLNPAEDPEAGAGYLEPDLTEFFPDVSVAETQSDKDPLPSDVSISSVLQSDDSVKIAEFKDWYGKATKERHRIYTQIGKISKRVRDVIDVEELKTLLSCCEQSKIRLANLNSAISVIPQTRGQKASYTRFMNTLHGHTVDMRRNIEKFLDKEIRLRDKATDNKDQDLLNKQQELEAALAKIADLELHGDQQHQKPSTGAIPKGVSNPSSDLFSLRRGTVENSVFIPNPTNPLRSGPSRGGGRSRGGASRHTWGDTGTDSESDTVSGDRFERLLSTLERAFSKKPDKPDYHGLEKCKLEPFNGEMELFQFWKKKFILAHENRNISQKDLAMRMFGLLRGEPRKIVESQLTGSWTDETFEGMVNILEALYGEEFNEDGLVIKRLNTSPPLSDMSLKLLIEFYQTITMQVSYYETRDQTALTNCSSHLFHQLRSKMVAFVYQKFRDWLEDRERERCVLSLQAWVLERIKSAKEADVLALKIPKQNRRGLFHIEKCEELSGEDSDDDGYVFLTGKSEGKNVSFEIPKKEFFSAGKFSRSRSPNRQNSRSNSPKRPILKPQIDFKSSKCPICLYEDHELAFCPKFKSLTVKQRYSVVRKSGTCFHCLQRGHAISNCPNDKGKVCGVNDCPKYNHPLLHADKTVGGICLTQWNSFVHGDLEWTEDDAKQFHGSCFLLAKPGARSILTVVCKIGNKKGRRSLKTVALLDSCSSMTCIDEDVARKLGLKKRSLPRTESIKVVSAKIDFVTTLVEVPVISMDGLTSMVILASTMKDMTKGTGIVDWSKDKLKFDHLKNLPFEPLPENPTVTLLIGTDNVDLLAPEESRKGEKGEPIAVLTPLGWTCFGSSSKSKFNTEALFESMFVSKLTKK